MKFFNKKSELKIVKENIKNFNERALERLNKAHDLNTKPNDVWQLLIDQLKDCIPTRDGDAENIISPINNRHYAALLTVVINRNAHSIVVNRTIIDGLFTEINLLKKQVKILEKETNG